MQVLETVVSHDRVEFRGDGGEVIAVTLAAGPALVDEELVAKAKVMLLHAASFGSEEEADRKLSPGSDVSGSTAGPGQEQAEAPPPPTPGVP
ncbi:hypothetical protein [Mesorhizobium sp. M1406]|uniref:hypothetical protein n=1 Tax=Mesorhizobium sp. M1406 TaxID=2957099 RepID=UPI0033351583